MNDTKMQIWWFSRIIAHYPYAIFIAVLMFSSTCLIVSLTIEEFPDFSDPQLGFEARGTELSNRLTAWDNLMKASTPRGNLVNDPVEFNEYLQHTYQQIGIGPGNANSSDQGIEKRKSKNKNVKKSKKIKDGTRKNVDRVRSGEEFFCNSPTPAYARVGIGSDSKNRNLWSLEGVLAQCHIDATLRSNPHFISLCQVRLDKDAKNECCRSWSPATYVAFLSNRTSCLGVTESDLHEVKKLLQTCAYYYYNRQLTEDCPEDLRCQKNVPTKCYDKNNAAYYLLHYLLDSEFISNGKISLEDPSNSILKSGMLILPIAASAAALDFYKSLNNEALVYNGFRVQGMELGLKSTLFDRLLVSDSILLLFSFTFIFICIWTYTSSLLLTITTILTVVFSLGISYTLYTMILKIKFFPFMNLLAIIVAVGIGADNSFIYYKVWESKKKQLSNTKCVQLVQKSLERALPSMFVTSLTTAVAFFVSIVSNVTAINCFSLFSGITVIANFFLMITWLPACVVISERCQFTILSRNNFIERKFFHPIRILLNELEIAFSAILIQAVVKFRWIWLTSFGGLTILGCIIVFKYPGLRLPDAPHFQLFENSHPFEQYDLIDSQRFRFENPDFGETITMPLRFVWGIKPIDNGDPLNPHSKGTIEWDETFDVSHPQSQKWLHQFCQNLRSQSFYRSTVGPLLSNCFIETLNTWMKRRCEDPLNSFLDRKPCCEKSDFPYTSQVFKQCAVEASIELYRTPTYLWTGNRRVAAGLRFFKESHQTNKTIPEIKALVVEYDSTYAYSFSFADMNTFYHEVETWMQNQLKNAPTGMRGGWFVSGFEFYELQNTLYHGTMWAMGLSIILALGVIAGTTLNPFISLYTILTIGAAIIVSTMALILLGWKLNVLESVAVSTAIGLAVDFSLHYGVSYKTSTNKHRLKRVEGAIKEMSGPTLMAAITSGAAGAFMLPSSVLAYIQIGIFLLIVMTISWIYATFFLCSTLAIFGPSSNFAQFKFPCFGFNAPPSPHFQKDEVENMMSGDIKIVQIESEHPGKGKLSESTSGPTCRFNDDASETSQ